MHRYTKKELVFIRKAYTKMTVRELTPAFNRKFGLNVTENQLHAVIKNHCFISGRTGRFEKGQLPWNRAKKGYMGPNATSFQKGNKPANWKPLGTERIDSKDGFILIKVAEHNPYTGATTRYKHKQVHIWETAHGPVPKGHTVAFKDNNRLNCALDNLMLITRNELLALNLLGYSGLPAELRPTVVVMAKLEAKAGIRTRPPRGRKS